MILPTMTPQEKQAQMKKLQPYLFSLAKKTLPAFIGQLCRAKVFPYFIVSPEMEMPDMGKWRMVYVAESKSNIKKGVVCVKAYQTFYVSHSKNPLNNGIGIYLFNGDDYGGVSCEEYPPHYFNRLRERFIEPKGIVQPDFHTLVKRMLAIHGNSMDTVVTGFIFRKVGGKLSMEFDAKYDRKDGYRNFLSYHKDGISLGVSTQDKSYVNFTTFIPNSMLFENQRDMQKKMMAEMREHELRLQTNPFATYNKREWGENYEKMLEQR